MFDANIPLWDRCFKVQVILEFVIISYNNCHCLLVVLSHINQLIVFIFINPSLIAIVSVIIDSFVIIVHIILWTTENTIDSCCKSDYRVWPIRY